jgi:hypothetical protein
MSKSTEVTAFDKLDRTRELLSLSEESVGKLLATASYVIICLSRLEIGRFKDKEMTPEKLRETRVNRWESTVEMLQICGPSSVPD